MPSTEQSNNKRIAKNTIYLYVRMLFTILVSLYTSRIVLQTLGASDYGLYNVIGGILTTFATFSAALTVGTQRFLTFAIGERDDKKLERTFSMALALHAILSLCILILAETVGLWFLCNYLNVPDGRMTAAVWVYQFTILGFIASLVQVPFQSCLISHERMGMYAYMGIYDAVMKLISVIMLQLVTIDKLTLYAALIFIVNLSSIMIYNAYSRRHFSECKFRLEWDKQLAIQFSSYCGWNLIGGSLDFFTNQGVNILLNIFCGTVVNAARGLSMTVNNFVTTFVTNFQTAVNPQIVKLYAAKEYEQMCRLVITNCRLAEYLYLIIAIPMFIEIKFVLGLWLGEYPYYTPIFVQIILIQSAWNPCNYPIGMLLHACGKLKWPSIMTGVMILIFPISYIILKLGYSPVVVFTVNAIIWLYLNMINLYFANRYVKISIKQVIREVYGNLLVGAAIMFAVPYLVSMYLEEGWQRFLVVGSVSLLTSAAVIYTIGMTSNMRNLVLRKLKLKK